MRRILTLVGLCAVAAMIVMPEARAGDATVRRTSDNEFTPSSVTVAVGDSVTFQWQGGFHNVVFDDGPNSGDPVSQDGKTWSRTFDAAGSFHFVCEVHESIGMEGTITVQGDPGDGGNGGGGNGGGGNGGGNSGPNSYPYTGPESELLPGIGGLFLASAAVRYALRRRRKRK